MADAKTKDPTLKKIVAALKKEFSPTRLFIFGSRASETHSQSSDYDFVVVVKKMQGNRVANMFRARKALEHLGVHADVFVYPEKEFEEWKDELSSIPETALHTGRELDLG